MPVAGGPQDLTTTTALANICVEETDNPDSASLHLHRDSHDSHRPGLLPGGPLASRTPRAKTSRQQPLKPPAQDSAQDLTEHTASAFEHSQHYNTAGLTAMDWWLQETIKDEPYHVLALIGHKSCHDVTDRISPAADMEVGDVISEAGATCGCSGST